MYVCIYSPGPRQLLPMVDLSCSVARQWPRHRFSETACDKSKFNIMPRFVFGLSIPDHVWHSDSDPGSCGHLASARQSIRVIGRSESQICRCQAVEFAKPLASRPTRPTCRVPPDKDQSLMPTCKSNHDKRVRFPDATPCTDHGAKCNVL